MKTSKKIIIGSLLLGASTATIIGTGAYITVQAQQNSTDLKLISQLEFAINPTATEIPYNSNATDNNGKINVSVEKYKKSNHYASEYAYASFYVPYSNEEPNLVSSNSF
ncbi:UNVERIFIED_CONTAM: hypothetical protein O8I53_13055 [Campylobacter lari]